jgi:hypothetical protein
MADNQKVRREKGRRKTKPKKKSLPRSTRETKDISLH